MKFYDNKLSLSFIIIYINSLISNLKNIIALLRRCSIQKINDKSFPIFYCLGVFLEFSGILTTSTLMLLCG